MASGFESSSRDVGWSWSWSGAAGGGTSGAIVGAGAGAAFGSIFFGIGAVPGAIIGGIVGGVIGFVAGGLTVGTSGDPEASAAENFGWGALVGIPAGIVGEFVGPAAFALPGIIAAAGVKGVASYLAVQGAIAVVETAIEYGVTQKWSSAEDKAQFSVGEVLVKNWSRIGW